MTVAALACPGARAATLVALGLDDLVNCADYVAVAHIESAKVSLQRDGHVQTTFVARVTTPLVACAADDILLVRQLGGTLAGKTTVVPGSPTLRGGEDVVLFLERRTDGTEQVLGLSQGLYHAGEPGSSPDGRLARRDAALADALIMGAAPAMPAPERLPLDQLVQRVRELVARRQADPATTCAARAPRP